MRIAIIGNNDGPERLAAALRGTAHEITLLAVQKGVRPHDKVHGVPTQSRTQVQRRLADEQSLANALETDPPDLVINCFANFRYTFLHHEYLVLNVHLAPLPRYRGRHPLQWALIKGEPTYGVTIHRINDDWDDGPIYWQENISVPEGWSARQLREVLFVRVEQNIAGLLDRLPTLKPLPNPAEEGSYLPRRSPADSLITDWTDRDHVFRKVMALRDDDNPAFGYLGGRRVVFTNATRPQTGQVGVPGTVVALGPDRTHSLLVATDGPPVCLTLKPDEPLPVTGQQFTTHP